MPPRRKQAPLDLGEMFRSIGTELAATVTKPNIYTYRPHEAQCKFHESAAKSKLFIGGNRSGKTVGGVAEAVWFLTKTHPSVELPDGPIRGRVVTTDLTRGVGLIILPLVKQFVPKEHLINGVWEDSYSSGDGLLTLANGSTLQFLSYEQSMDKHAGTSLHFVWFDEEPPYNIFKENLLRLLDTDGWFWVTMTPLLGMTWIAEQLYDPYIKNPSAYPDRFVLRVNTNENPYIKEAAKSRILGFLDADERKQREEGQFVDAGGKVFEGWNSGHVVNPGTPKLLDDEGLPPKWWNWYMSIDSGWKNPTAILWHAVSPEGLIITFAEHYQSKMTVAEHVQVIKAKEAEWGVPITLRTGDPAIKQRREGTGTSIFQEYALRDIYLSLDNVPTGPGSVAVGVERMNAYINSNMWLVSANCTNLLRELPKLRFESYTVSKRDTLNAKETIVKKDDHAFDSSRYFFTLMPNPAPTIEVRNLQSREGSQRYDTALVAALRNSKTASIDNDISTDSTAWVVVE